MSKLLVVAFLAFLGFNDQMLAICPGDECEGLCCPEANYICCEDGLYCAETMEKCPDIKLTRTKAICDPGYTNCPHACCPLDNAICCPDGYNCAYDLIDCQTKTTFNALEKASKVEKLLKKAKCDIGDTDCPEGCCPVSSAFCCPDGFFCATDESNCPTLAAFLGLFPRGEKDGKFGKILACPDNGTQCPGGCCPISDASCCADGLYCAPTLDQCPQF
jgi:hypothetical protein